MPIGFQPTYFVIPRKPRNPIEAQKLYNHIRTVAFWLDAISGAIPVLDQLPFEVGVDAIVGAFLPAVGDAIGVVFGLYQVFLSSLFGLSWYLLGLMLLNIFIDGVVGVIPIVGDFLDVAFKSNLRNLSILERHLTSSRHFTVVLGPSGVFDPSSKTKKSTSSASATAKGWWEGVKGARPSGKEKFQAEELQQWGRAILELLGSSWTTGK